MRLLPFLFHRKVRPMKSKTLREDCTAAEMRDVAIATRRRRRIPRAGFFLICLLSVAAGGLRMGAEKKRALEAERLVLDGAQGQVTGTVSSVRDDGGRLVLILDRCSAGCEGEAFGLRRVQVYLEKETDSRDVKIRIGNRFRAFGSWSRFRRARNPGGFDAWLYSRAEKLDARLYAESGTVTEDGVSWYREGLRLLSAEAHGILERITDGTDTGIYRAAVLGDKAGLDDEIRDMYQRNGIAHLLAISGLHMSLLGMGAYAIFRRIGGGFGLAGAAGAAFVISYGMMAGGSASVVRASVMLLCSFGAAYLGRSYDLLSALGLAGILLLWDSPYLVTQGGFQLSFGAVFGIGVFSQNFGDCFSCSKRWELVGKGLSAVLCVQLATAPIIQYHYFQLPLYGMLLNLVAVPLMGYVVVSGLAGILLGGFSLQAGVFAVGAGHYILAFYEWLCRLCERLPWSNLVLGRPQAWQIGGYYLVLALVWTGIKGRWFRRGRVPEAGLALVGLALAYVFLLPVPGRGLAVTFLDVGQGDGIFLQTGHETMLVDGGSSDEKRLGEYILEPFLKSRGVRVIDYAWVTHGDRDHTSGLSYLLSEGRDIKVRNLMLPVLGREDEAYEPLCSMVRERGGEVFWVGKGDVLEIGKMRVACLYPGEDDVAEDRNEQSLVLKVDYGDFHMLLTGDMSERGEQAVAEDGDVNRMLADTQVLKVAHHGSRFSTSGLWLDAVKPVWAVVSYGQGNRYGHPHNEVRERLQMQDVVLWETAECGAVSLWTDGEKLRWERYLE